MTSRRLQLAIRAVGFLGSLGGILTEGVLDTILPNDHRWRPSKSLIGKVASGVAGAHPDTLQTARARTPQPKPDDKGNDPNQHQGTGTPPGPGNYGPMFNIENFHNNGNPNDGQSAARDLARVQDAAGNPVRQ